MKEYLWVVKQVMSQFSKAKVVQVARGQNTHVDSLATLASSMMEDVPQMIKVEFIAQPSIDLIGVAMVLALGPYWMEPIINFLVEDQVPDDEKEANKVRRMVARYWLSTNRKLYQRSFWGSYLLCLHPKRVNGLLAKLHDGLCGSHAGGHSLAHRAMTQGFWWLRMQKDATEYVRKCEQCQKHAPLIHQLAGHLNLVNSP